MESYHFESLKQWLFPVIPKIGQLGLWLINPAKAELDTQLGWPLSSDLAMSVCISSSNPASPHHPLPVPGPVLQTPVTHAQLVTKPQPQAQCVVRGVSPRRELGPSESPLTQPGQRWPGPRNSLCDQSFLFCTRVCEDVTSEQTVGLVTAERVEPVCMCVCV